MRTYISILRGINVSGQKLIKMEALRKSYETHGFQNVSSYLQSGNIIFSCTETETRELEENISARIATDFGFDVPVIVLTIDILKRIIENNSFVRDNGKSDTFMHVTFLSSVPDVIDQKFIAGKKHEGEEIIFTDRVVYLYCPNGYGQTKLNNSFLESKLKVKATTRNWKTTNELLSIAQQVEVQTTLR